MNIMSLLWTRYLKKKNRICLKKGTHNACWRRLGRQGWRRCWRMWRWILLLLSSPGWELFLWYDFGVMFSFWHVCCQFSKAPKTLSTPHTFEDLPTKVNRYEVLFTPCTYPINTLSKGFLTKFPGIDHSY